MSYEQDFGFYLKSFKKRVNDWKPPFWKLFDNPMGQILEIKNLADSFEAVLGACFVNQYNLYHVIKALHQLIILKKIYYLIFFL